MTRTTPTLLALHGHGEAPATAASWAERMRPQGWNLELAVAPGGRSDDHSWFDTGPRGVDPADLRRSTESLLAAVSALGGDGPVVLAGFSQGAAMALATQDMPRVAGIVAVCPFLPEVEGLDLASGARAVILPAADDDVTPSFLGEDAAAALRSAGRTVELRTTGGGHEVGEEAAAIARRWMSDRWPGRQRVSLGLPVERVGRPAEFLTGEAVADISRCYERLGFDAAYVTDHPAPDDRWLASGGHQALEPTVALAIAGAATTGMLLHTHVYVLGYRSPFLSAKAIASLDVLTGGRVMLGVAAGYLRPEFEALGTDFGSRGDRLDEILELLPRIWSGEPVEASSDGSGVRTVTALPRPLQQPHPPIWVGGNSERAMRRAARFGQGWAPFPTPAGLERATRTAAIADVASLRSRIGRFSEICEAEGHESPLPVCFTPFSVGEYLGDSGAVDVVAGECAELWELGVDWVALSLPGSTRSELLDNAGRLAEALQL